jgi:hypothetical protein
MILQMPKGSASRRILSMYFIGSLNSFSVGLNTGASTWTRRKRPFFFFVADADAKYAFFLKFITFGAYT